MWKQLLSWRCGAWFERQARVQCCRFDRPLGNVSPRAIARATDNNIRHRVWACPSTQGLTIGPCKHVGSRTRLRCLSNLRVDVSWVHVKDRGMFAISVTCAVGRISREYLLCGTWVRYPSELRSRVSSLSESRVTVGKIPGVSGTDGPTFLHVPQRTDPWLSGGPRVV